MKSLRLSFYLSICCLLTATWALAQAQPANAKAGRIVQLDQPKASAKPTDLLKQYSNSLETLVAKASPAVVEILVTGFGPIEDSDGNRTALVGRQSKLGSGVIVDSGGYIMTNAHVISNAQSIEVVISALSKNLEDGGVEKSSYAASVVGVHKDTDLALLKINATGLPFLRLDPKRPIRQVQLVLALGNPEGLGNSVTMGVVSAVDRQPDPRLPMVFIQTDAPINPGNSGGPLIDVDGYMLGINTFIVTQGGGSEGLGFAIPSRVVSFVFDRLRRFGHVDRSEIGASSEEITPLLAKGLQLPVNSGVFIVDVIPDGPADTAGVKINDVVLAVDGKQIRSLPQLVASLYLHPTVDPEKNLVRKIGVLASDLDDRTAALVPGLRITSGVIVVANTNLGRAVDVGLRPGDVIHALNTKPIGTLAELQTAINAIDSGAVVVLQVERRDGLDYVAFEMP